MKHLLVTGGSGFIGSNFLRYFLAQHPDVSVINLDKLTYAGVRANTQDFERNPYYEFVQGDICDVDTVRQLMKSVEGVIHFAAETHVDRSIDMGRNFALTNVVGTNILLEAAKEARVKRFLHFSTDEVYGSCATGSFSEDSPLNPSSPYSASKAASDLLALSYWKTHQLPVVIIRSTNNFGPFQFPEKVIPLFITNLIEGKKVPLYSKGENVRDWLYVGDCIKAIDFIMERGHAGEIYNLGGGHEMNNLDLTHHILYAFGKNDESIQYVQDRPAHDFRYSLNTLKLKKLGFEIQPKFETHLKETIEWYRAHRSWWEPLKTDTYTLK
ncbi:MAG: dTDP-glucose 4,6-dehydratase [Omnitrophica bacterium RIFCSPHIGHO2_02_FULL_46_11]|nr:MAG: dTDP-glucose 4,6-dehydratase [Omnitrophica bacterium RIFCSPHIGHO2_02_FULL_46_11]